LTEKDNTAADVDTVILGDLDTMMTDLIDDLDELKVRGLDVLDLRLDINQVFRVFIEQQIIKLV
jgi:hypothetical protein